MGYQTDMPGRKPKVISMFSGMEAASVAAHPLGWKFEAFSEIEPSACQTLHAHYGCGRPVHLPLPADATSPKEARVRAARIRAVAGLPERTDPDAPVNLGDMTQVDWTVYRDKIDIVVGGPPCFPAGTLILSKRGFLPIEDVIKGDEVLTHRLRWRRVVNTMQKRSPTIILKGQGHWGLETTHEHPFFSRKVAHHWVRSKAEAKASGLKTKERFVTDPKWVEARNMRGHHWSGPSEVPFEDALDILRNAAGSKIDSLSPEFAWVLGAWLGDGWLRRRKIDGYRKHSFVICAGKHQADELSLRLSCAGFMPCRSEQRTTIRFEIGNSNFVDWVERHFGCGASEKRLPAWIFALPESFRSSFLKGYMFADGHTQQNPRSKASFNRITTVSRHLAVGVRMLINSLGFGASVMRYQPRPGGCVIENRRVNEKPQFQISYYAHSRSAFFYEGMMWGCVRQVMETGETKDVFNIEVEEDNSYVADGIIVHNCQAFSWAGNRQSLDDHRGNLSLAYVRAIHAIRPLWGFTENVPGWLSTKDNAFGCYLGALVGADSPLRVPGGGRWGSAGVVDGPFYRAAWRILDSQGFVPQRRRRVFVVAARVGSGGDPVRVLFETEAEAAGHLGDRSGGGPLFPLAQGMFGNPEARDEAGAEPSHAVQARSSGPVRTWVRRVFAFGANRCSGEADVASALTAHGGPNGRQDFESEVFLVGVPEALGLSSAADHLAAREHLSVPEKQASGFETEASECLFRIENLGDLDEPGLLTPGNPAFIHVNKGRPNGRKSAHVDIVTAKPLVETITTDGHARSAVVIPGVGPDFTLAFSSKDYGADLSGVSPTPRVGNHDKSHANSGAHVAVIYRVADGEVDRLDPRYVVGIPTDEGMGYWNLSNFVVRRLTTRECLSLQGFPTDYLDGIVSRGKSLSDGPRYKLCGNSWTVPLVRWVFNRMNNEIGTDVRDAQGGAT